MKIWKEHFSFKYVALLEGRCSSSFLQGHPPSLRFGHPDVTFGRHRPSTRPLGYRRWRAVFSGSALRVSHGRSPMRSEEEAERPGDGCPCVGAEETCGVPPQTLWFGTRTITAFPSGTVRKQPLSTREHKRGAASHTGDSASVVKAGSAEKLSLPRRTQPESAHARGRRQPARG